MESMLGMADKEFDGESFNGPSLMATLDSLTAEQAASEATFEGYSAWEIAIHCAWYKHFIARSLGAKVELFPYPYAEKNFAPIPAPPDDVAWKTTRAVLRRAHHEAMQTFRDASSEELDAMFSEWGVPFREAIAWLCTHDVFHNAQIRTMGVPGLRQPKEH
ncbi:MAG: hypothetical protein A2Z99_14380 [Treponema sp. GWB1_62_6]|nr:MAG: hypothetical protein A2001_21040 [Treponema sp. GWC1_61_84]OHE71624.1 MAG: hypothetical protein A2Z99_14380 [Treponema sp. GWB1_62_6]OHE72755.1 MAG: hypothetical protein A2413_14475 [Treponema sp. RIFOXYC1_FULL_61_9]